MTGRAQMRLNHVTLIVSDLARSKAFYERLGLRAIVHSPPRYARFVMPGEEATLSLEVTGAAPQEARAELFFECDDLDERVRALKSQGVEFYQDPIDMRYLWREARLRDPDGHELRLYFAGDNRLNPPWRLPQQ
jgi:catechol 2,3-dioxygenase-like lactoylglutathione lyase family enzyme